MPKKVLLLLARGFEELEAVAPIDFMRRAGITVTLASIHEDINVTSRGSITIVADTTFDKVSSDDFDAVVMPGGSASEIFKKDERVLKLLKEMDSKQKLVSAICASPIAIHAAKVGFGKKITAYPSYEKIIGNDYEFIESKAVVSDGNLLTSRGPGTAMAFGLELVEYLVGKEARVNVEKQVLTDQFQL